MGLTHKAEREAAISSFFSPLHHPASTLIFILQLYVVGRLAAAGTAAFFNFTPGHSLFDIQSPFVPVIS